MSNGFRRGGYALRLLVVTLLLGASLPSVAFTITDIRLQGLQRVSAGTVFNVLPVKVGDTVDEVGVRQLMRTLFKSGYFKDIRMAELVAKARRHQPGLLVVDRGVGGRFEDYKTPEQAIPARPPTGPWESCITMAEQWSFRCKDDYKSSRQLIHMLARIVAGGGNLLLNVGPRPDGRLPREALTRLAEIGSWLRVNAAAIYGTRPVHRSTTGPLCLTRNKTTLYAICLAEEGHDIPSARIVVPAVRNATSVELLGVPGPLAWQCGPMGLTAELPDRVRHALPCRHAWTLAITGATTDPTAAT